MNSTRYKTNKLTAAIGLLVICSSMLVACGGSGDSSDTTAGIGGTGIVSGQITGFGSIHVNGGKFDIDTSQFNVDGDVNATQADLALGMVVQLKVETEAGIYTGRALEVNYDDEIEGPVTNIMFDGTLKTGIVFGQTITFDEATTIYVNTSFGSIGEEGALLAPDVIEVSGFRFSDNEIAATYVRFIEDLNPGVTEVELRGPVKSLTGVPPNQNFMIDGTMITTNIVTELEVDGEVLVPDLYVEVKGKIQNDLSVIADKVESEDEDFGGDVDDISLQGIISMFNDITDFEIDGQAIDASQVSPANLSPANAASLLGEGVEIEVEGDIVNGVLIAEELELREGETKLKSFVSFVYADNIRFEVGYTGLPGSIVINTNGQTLFDDEGPLQLSNFSVADMNVGDFVIVEGIESADEVIAETVKRKNSVDPDDSELEGQVDIFVVDTSITVLGITYDVSVADFEDATGPVSSAVFFSQLAPGVLVEIKDEEAADGIAEEVELE